MTRLALLSLKYFVLSAAYPISKSLTFTRLPPSSTQTAIAPPLLPKNNDHALSTLPKTLITRSAIPRKMIAFNQAYLYKFFSNLSYSLCEPIQNQMILFDVFSTPTARQPIPTLIEYKGS